MLMAYAQTGQGAVLMANTNLNNDFMNEVLRSIAIEYRWPSYPVKQRITASVAPATLDTYAGRYELQPNLILTIRRHGGDLFAQATGQSEFPLYAESNATFFLTVVEAKATFVTNAKGIVSELIWHQGGATTRAKRIP